MIKNKKWLYCKECGWNENRQHKKGCFGKGKYYTEGVIYVKNGWYVLYTGEEFKLYESGDKFKALKFEMK